MSEKSIIGKEALSIDGHPLGPIIRIDKLPGKLIKRLEQYVIIQAVKKWRTRINIPIEVTKIHSFDSNTITFDITKEVYDKELERQKVLDHEKKRYQNMVNIFPRSSGPFKVDNPSNRKQRRM